MIIPKIFKIRHAKSDRIGEEIHEKAAEPTDLKA